VTVPNRLVAWAANNRPKIVRYTYVLQVVTGLFLLALGYSIGKDHFHLLRAGVRTSGTIVDYKEQYFSNSSRTSSTSAFMPIVQFPVGGRVVQFKDWMGTNSAVLRKPVTVLYDPANPLLAMIDRPVWNWIPWGPTFAVGLFLFLVGTGGLIRSTQT
jgi:Protein of unknown function (DUF3592)